MDDTNLAETDEYTLGDEIPALTDGQGQAVIAQRGDPDGKPTDAYPMVTGLLLVSRAKRLLLADGLTRITTDKALRARQYIEELGPENVPAALMSQFLELVYLGHRLAGTEQEHVLSLFAERLLVFAGRLEDVIDTKLGSNGPTGILEL